MTLIYINEEPLEQDGLDIEGFKELISQQGKEHTQSKYINFEDKIGTKLNDMSNKSKPIYFFTYRSLELVLKKLKKFKEVNQILQSQNQTYEFSQKQLYEMTQQELQFHRGTESSCLKCSSLKQTKDQLEKMKSISITKQNDNQYLLERNQILEMENQLKVNDQNIRIYIDELKNCQSIKQLEEKLNETIQQNLELQTLKTRLTRQNLDLQKKISAQGQQDEKGNAEVLQKKLEQKNQEIDRVKNIITRQDQAISEYQEQINIKNKCVQCEQVMKTFERLIEQNQNIQQQIQLEKTINQKNYEIVNNYDQQYFKIIQDKNYLEKQVIDLIQTFSPYQNSHIISISSKLNEFVEQNEKFYTELEKLRKLNANLSNSLIKQIGQQSVIRKQVI